MRTRRIGPLRRATVLIAVMTVLPAQAFQASSPDLAKEARAALFAYRYEDAIELYRKALAVRPAGDVYYGLTRALLRDHRTAEAYAAADEGLERAAHTPGAETGAGLAAFRRGDISAAESYFGAALQWKPDYGGALKGSAAINAAVSREKSALDQLRRAFAAWPDDPDLMLAHANTLKGAEHIAALERVLSLIDAKSEEARGLRAHIASDRALGERRPRRLLSPYAPAQIKLTRIMNDSRRLRGFGLRVRFNQRYTATLLLDTGASGISLSPKAVKKAALEPLGDASREAKGIGDKKPEDELTYLASEVGIGSLVLADYPISVFRSAKDADSDGLIGADVFSKFLVTLDFPRLELMLQPYPKRPGDDPQDTGALATGFHRVLRAGDHLMIATSVNNSAAKWFLIDSGSSDNFMDTETARTATGVYRDDRTAVRGIQGKVERVSRADRITLAFAGFRQENPDVIAISLERPSDALGIQIGGLIGMPVLGQLRLTLDYEAGAVRFERPK